MSDRWRRFAWHYEAVTNGAFRPGEAEFYCELALASSGPAVEPACGAGRVLCAVARRGIAVWGADTSPDLLALAARRLRHLAPGVEATLVLQPIEGFAPPGCGLILIPLDGLRLLRGARALARFLAAAAAALRPGGKLALDITLPEAELPGEHRMPPLRAPDGSVVNATSRWTIGPKQTIETTEFEIVTSGAVERLVYRDAYTNLAAEKVVAAVAAAGFGRIETFGDFEGTPFAGGAGRLVLAAEGPGRGRPNSPA